jgi:lipopolysaccharide biosynthesis glycosyltransferase
MKEPIKIATACNDNYIHGLAVTISSILDSAKEEQVEIYVLDAGLSEANKQKILKIAKKINNRSTVRFVHVDESVFIGLNKDYGNGYATYYRLLLGKYCNSNRLIYIDADFLWQKNVRELWEGEMNEKIACATRDCDNITRTPATLADDCPFSNDSEFLKKPYFNCGIMMLDLDKWRAKNIENLALQITKGFEDRLKAWDQTILNYVLAGEIKEIPLSWAESNSWVPKDKGSNIHFISKMKPWNSWSMNPGYRAWRKIHRELVSEFIPISFNIKTITKGLLMDLRDILCSRSSLLKNLYIVFLEKKGTPEKSRLYFCSYISKLSNHKLSDILR